MICVYLKSEADIFGVLITAKGTRRTKTFPHTWRHRVILNLGQHSILRLLIVSMFRNSASRDNQNQEQSLMLRKAVTIMVEESRDDRCTPS